MTRTAGSSDDVVRLRQAKGMPVMFKSTSTSLVLLGILAVIVGVFAIAWPGVTILALVILFAVYAFLDGGCRLRGPLPAGEPGRSSVTCCSG
jgi:uncharacterized membrane protein HdeD (DUF308 family)